MLRRGVVAFVGEERHAGTSPGRVILTLTKLIEHARVSRAERHALMRRVILWCVEAYFGYLGGQLHGPVADDSAQSAEPPAAHL